MRKPRHRACWLMCGLCSALTVSFPTPPVRAGVTSQVDTRRGSASTYAYSRGNTYPATAVPFGFNLYTPVSKIGTAQTGCAADNPWACRYAEAQLYSYASDALIGFAVTHQPSPWMGDYGTLLIAAGMGPAPVAPQAGAQRYAHRDETARPDRYQVTFAGGLQARLAPTDHAAALEFIFAEPGEAYLQLSLLGTAQGTFELCAGGQAVTAQTTLQGQTLYIYARWQTAPAAGASHRVLGSLARVWHEFRVDKGQRATLQVGTSWLSVAQARANLEQEIGERSYAKVAEASERLWDAALAQIEVEGSEELQRIFYANMYRTLLFPTARAEQRQGGSVYLSPYDGQVHAGKMWVNNGFWDTHRAVWPLLTLLDPARTGAMLDGFVGAAREGGWTPRWTAPGYRDVMVGTHTDIVFADAMGKGVEFDHAGAYAAAVKNATVYSALPDRGRPGLRRSTFLGYLPTDVAAESAAWFLEDCLNDFGISQMATALGHSDEATYFRQRALRYANLYAPNVGFFRGRTATGAWRTKDADFSPATWGYEFTEGCAWHYATPAAHDPQGMANLFGGRAQLADKIDALFAASPTFLPGSYGQPIHEMVEGMDAGMGQYAHPNEPVHHMLYMYNYAAKPAQAQKWLRRTMDPSQGIYTLGSHGGGYLGDEDNGQMSAWYIFSAMGFYPASMGHAEYAIGSPLFTRVALHLPHGKTFAVEAPRNSARNIYIQAASLNGEPLTRTYLRHAEVVAGGTLHLEMGPTPSAWGSGADDVPTSLTRGTRAPRPWTDATRGSKFIGADNSGTQAALCDDDGLTTWTSAADKMSATWQLANNTPRRIALYTLTNAAGGPSRDPQSWELSGSQDGHSWTLLDRRTEQSFRWPNQTRAFGVQAPAALRFYRITFTAPHNAALQVNEIELLYDPDGA